MHKKWIEKWLFGEIPHGLFMENTIADSQMRDIRKTLPVASTMNYVLLPTYVRGEIRQIGCARFPL